MKVSIVGREQKHQFTRPALGQCNAWISVLHCEFQGVLLCSTMYESGADVFNESQTFPGKYLIEGSKKCSSSASNLIEKYGHNHEASFCCHRPIICCSAVAHSYGRAFSERQKSRNGQTRFSRSLTFVVQYWKCQESLKMCQSACEESI